MATPTTKFALVYKSGVQQEFVHRPIVGPNVDKLSINFEAFLKGNKQTTFMYSFRDRPQGNIDASVNVHVLVDFSQLASIKKLEE